MICRFILGLRHSFRKSFTFLLTFCHFQAILFLHATHTPNSSKFFLMVAASNRLGVEVFQLHVDVAQGFLEVEVFVYFLRGDADVAAGGEAPVVGFDSLRSTSLPALPRHAVLPPGSARSASGPAVEIAHLFELFDGGVPRLVGGLAGAGDVAVGPGIAVSGVALLLAGIDQAAGELVEQVRLLDQIAAGLGQRGKPVHRLIQFVRWWSSGCFQAPVALRRSFFEASISSMKSRGARPAPSSPRHGRRLWPSVFRNGCKRSRSVARAAVNVRQWLDQPLSSQMRKTPVAASSMR